MAPVVHDPGGTRPKAAPGGAHPRQKHRRKRRPRRGISLVRLMLVIALAVLVAAGFHAFLYQAFRVPSGSMKPTLLVGDSILVSKLAYGGPFRGCILGWCPEAPPIGGLPERGDVIVFRDTVHGGYAAKRIVGLPGDEVAMLGGRLYLDGQAVEQRPGVMFHEVYEAQGQLGQRPLCANPDAGPGAYCLKPVQIETLPNGVTYDTLQIGAAAVDTTAPIVVSAGAYFVMGDNRDNSTDSRLDRAGGGYGSVLLADIVGRVEMILFSTAADDVMAPGTLRRSRLFLPISEARLRRAQ
jgi:signal peptidase I